MFTKKRGKANIIKTTNKTFYWLSLFYVMLDRIQGGKSAG